MSARVPLPGTHAATSQSSPMPTSSAQVSRKAASRAASEGPTSVVTRTASVMAALACCLRSASTTSAVRAW